MNSPPEESAGTSSSADTRPGPDSTRQRPRPTPRNRHYGPRTCRICLDVVHPTTEIDDYVAAGLFTSKPRVRYVSEDPELGRLISPCRCRGSQKYVHEGCLRAWRQAAPLSDRNFWRCPTCHFEYRMERLTWGRWLSSPWLRAALTALVMLAAIFLLGFVADPIINLWLDPIGSIADTIADVVTDIEALEKVEPDEPATWSYHFLKGLFSLGLLGFIKSLFAMTPWQWFNIRFGGGGGFGGRRRGVGGRDRLESINWAFILIGLLTFMGVSTHNILPYFFSPHSFPHRCGLLTP